MLKNYILICVHYPMNSYEDDFGPYQEGEDEIACTYETPDEFEAAMREWIKRE